MSAAILNVFLKCARKLVTWEHNLDSNRDLRYRYRRNKMEERERNKEQHGEV